MRYLPLLRGARSGLCHQRTEAAVQGSGNPLAVRRHDGIRRADRCILLRLVPASDPSAAGSDDPRQEVWREPLPAADGQLYHLRLQQAKAKEVAGRYIQISVPIAPGSSGGALIDESGKVIGITSAGFSNSTGDLNLAIPSNQALKLDKSSTADYILWQEEFYPASSKIYDFGVFSGVKEISSSVYPYGWSYIYDVFDFHEGDGSLKPEDCYVSTMMLYRDALLDKGFIQAEADETEMGGYFESDDEAVLVSIDLDKERTISIVTYRIPEYYEDLPTLPDLGWYLFIDPADAGPYQGSFMYQYIWSDYYSADVFSILLDLYFELLEEEGYVKRYDDGEAVLYEGNGVSAFYNIGKTDIWVDAKPI